MLLTCLRVNMPTTSTLPYCAAELQPNIPADRVHGVEATQWASFNYILHSHRGRYPSDLMLLALT